MRNETKRNIEESYENIKLYLNDPSCTAELIEMCDSCEAYCGSNHDYSECKDRMCFKMYLAFNYLDLINGY